MKNENFIPELESATPPPLKNLHLPAYVATWKYHRSMLFLGVFVSKLLILAIAELF